jgi:hypothetical protein
MTYLLVARTAETQSERQRKLKMLATAADNWNRTKPVTYIPSFGIMYALPAYTPAPLQNVIVLTDDKGTVGVLAVDNQTAFDTSTDNTVTTWFEEDRLILCIEGRVMQSQSVQFIRAVKAQVGGVRSAERDPRCNCFTFTFRRTGDIQAVRQQLTDLARRFMTNIQPGPVQTSMF